METTHLKVLGMAHSLCGVFRPGASVILGLGGKGATCKRCLKVAVSKYGSVH